MKLISKPLKDFNREELEKYMYDCSVLFSDKISKENFRKMIKVSSQIAQELNNNIQRVKKTKWSEAIKAIETYIPDYLVETLSKCP